MTYNKTCSSCGLSSDILDHELCSLEDLTGEPASTASAPRWSLLGGLPPVLSVASPPAAAIWTDGGRSCRAASPRLRSTSVGLFSGGPMMTSGRRGSCPATRTLRSVSSCVRSIALDDRGVRATLAEHMSCPPCLSSCSSLCGYPSPSPNPFGGIVS